jgi:hypothetical protein
MIEIVWEFVVKPEAVARFRRAYGPDGDWAALFRQHAGYGGTTLLEDVASAKRFLTIDRWEHESQLREMRRAAEREYRRLDAQFQELTLSERELGAFRRVDR